MQIVLGRFTNLSRHLVGLTAVSLLLACAVSSVAPVVAVAQQQAGKAGELRIDDRADGVLKSMSLYYKSLHSIEFDVSALMVAESITQRTERPASYHVAIERPDKFLITSKKGRREGTAVSDGSKCTYYSSPVEAYMTTTAPSSLAEAFNEPEFLLVTSGWLSMALVDEIVADNPYGSITLRSNRIAFVDEGDIDGVKCDHLRIEQPKISCDVWVEQGKTPVIRKVVPDLSHVELRRATREDAPKISLVFKYENVKVDEAFKPDEFAFVPPPRVKQVRSLFDPVKHPMEGQKAPDFTLSLLDGGKLHLSQLRDKVVVIDFWSTHASLGNLPDFAEMQNPLHEKGVEFFAINQKESPERVSKFLQDSGLDISVALDQDGSIADLYKVTGLPEMVVIGKDGLVKIVHSGYSPLLKQMLVRELNELTQGKELEN